MRISPRRRQHRGATLIEVLVTVVIIAFGLLGLAGLQVRMQMSEMEAYQRSQALMLLSDLASRLSANRADAASYVTGPESPVGTGFDCSTLGESRAATDLKEWCEGLQGAAEFTTSGGVTTQQGAMIGGRGCVELADDGDYLITVAWQGLTPIAAPVESVACGAGEYNGGAGAVCVNDLCRRTVTTVVRIGSLI
jgi:type IV pilus assembly protein PilV